MFNIGQLEDIDLLAMGINDENDRGRIVSHIETYKRESANFKTMGMFLISYK